MHCGRVMRVVVLTAASAASLAPFVSAQTSTEAAAATTDAAPGFSAEQLEQIVAPIALYPDSLVMQILMASTYPLEIVEAARWVEKNPGLTGKALDAALQEQNWDPAIKVMCGFPTVIAEMSDNLDWTRDLGDAVLDQKTELLDAVQRMRDKAYEAGNLKTTEQQVVTRQADKIIVIESKSPEVIYVPTYSPVVVYGPSWYYPTYYYPALYVPPPPGYGLMLFGAGVAWGAYLHGGCSWGWGHGDIDVNVKNEYNFNRNTNVGNGSWKHDAEHRKGVNYRSGQTAKLYGGSGAGSRVTRDQARGYDRGGSAGTLPAQRPGGAAPAQNVAGKLPSAGTRDLGGARASTGAAQTGISNRAAAGDASSRVSRDGNSAFSGSRSPSFDRAASGRGASSRASLGGGRASGGRAGGGGRGR